MRARAPRAAAAHWTHAASSARRLPRNHARAPARMAQPRCGAPCGCACAASGAPQHSETQPPPTPERAVSFSMATPVGDERPRSVCTTCGFIDYKNPKVVVGALVVNEGRVLLCRRAIEPSAGKWGFPQGFLELGESGRRGAAREAAEEAGADVAVGPLLSLYDLPGILLLVYLARLRPSPHLGPRPESSAVAWFAWDELPADAELAFPTVGWALGRARAVLADAPRGSAWADGVRGAPPRAQECAAADVAGDCEGEGTGGAWFAPQQRTKCAAPPGYIVEA